MLTIMDSQFKSMGRSAYQSFVVHTYTYI